MDGLVVFMVLGFMVCFWVFLFNRGTKRSDKQRASDDRLNMLNLLNLEEAERAREQDAQSTGLP